MGHNVKVFLLSLMIATGGLAVPNVIVLLIDDLGSEACTPYGGEPWSTPNIDQIAYDGMRFENMFAAPRCAPARASLLTSRNPWVQLDPVIGSPVLAGGPMDTNEVTMADILVDEGYDTFFCGKWNLRYGSDDDTASNFTNQHIHITDCGFTSIGQTTIGHTMTYGDPTNAVNYMPYKVNQSALTYLDTATEPFYMQYSFGLLHEAHTDEYGAIGLPPTPLNPADFPTTETASNQFTYCSIYIDILVSNIIAKVESLNIESNTVIILTGDNGTITSVTSSYNNVNVAGGKASAEDTGSWVPFYVRWDGVIATNSTYVGLSSFKDVMPTIAEICGADMPTDRIIDGKSFYQGLLGTSSSHRIRTNMSLQRRSGEFRARKISGVWSLYSVTNKPFGDVLISSPNTYQNMNKGMLAREFENYTNTVFGIQPQGWYLNDRSFAQ